MTLSEFSVNNKVLINIVMITLLVLGVLSLSRMPQEQFAEVPFFWVIITVPAPGFSAEDVERRILIPIEDEMSGLDSLDTVQSTAQEGLGTVRVQFSDGISRNEFKTLYQDVRTRFSRVVLPDEALQATINDFSSNDFLPVIEVVVHGDTDYGLLRQAALLLEDDLKTIDDVSGIDASHQSSDPGIASVNEIGCG